jgi:hypothetical protein
MNFVLNVGVLLRLNAMLVIQQVLSIGGVIVHVLQLALIDSVKQLQTCLINAYTVISTVRHVTERIIIVQLV